MLVKLLIKTPNQQFDDEAVECRLSWTVRQLKEHLTNVYPTAPDIRDQRLIFSGHLLRDDQCLSDVFHPQADERLEFTVHLMVTQHPQIGTPSSSAPPSSGSGSRSATSQQNNSTSSFSDNASGNSHPNLNNPHHNQMLGQYFTNGMTAFPPYGTGHIPTMEPDQLAAVAAQQQQTAAVYMQHMYAQYMNQYLSMMGPMAAGMGMAAGLGAAGAAAGTTPGAVGAAGIPIMAGVGAGGAAAAVAAAAAVPQIPMMANVPQIIPGGGGGFAMPAGLDGMMMPLMGVHVPIAAAAAAVDQRDPVIERDPPPAVAQPVQVQPAAAAAPPAPQPPQAQVLNAGPGGGGMAAAAGGGGDDLPENEAERDWLDWIYYMSRAAIFLMVIYVYSSFARFCMVLVLAITLWVYQTQRRAIVNLQENRRNEAALLAAAVRQAQQQQQAAHRDNQDEERDERATDGEENADNGQPDRGDGIGPRELIEMMDGDRNGEQVLRHRRPAAGVGAVQGDGSAPDRNNNTAAPPPQPPSTMRTLWVFLSSFFLSLIPEQPDPLNA